MLTTISVGVYISHAAAKSVVGIGTPMDTERHKRACVFFIVVRYAHISMVGRTGEPQGSPVSVPGSSNPVRLTTR
ncbi:ash family protein [Yersinia enterocolitica]|uniref:ash family protein n=1 Tax=Yersinia enterocolitica TaxID=630 RepID=UPI001C686BB9|nr:ash family protein [Yersinia enterocolitica]MBW5833021.1 ash family protein [Yersinia enterocolitica]